MATENTSLIRDKRWKDIEDNHQREIAALDDRIQNHMDELAQLKIKNIENDRIQNSLRMKMAQIAVKQNEHEMKKMEVEEYRKCREQLNVGKRITNSLKMMEIALKNDHLPRIRAMKQKENIDRINKMFDEIHQKDFEEHEQRKLKLNATKSEIEQIQHEIDGLESKTASIESKLKENKLKSYGIREEVNSMNFKMKEIRQEIDGMKERLKKKEEHQREYDSITKEVQELRRRTGRKEILKPNGYRRESNRPESADDASVCHSDDNVDRLDSQSVIQQNTNGVIDLTSTQTDDEISDSSDAQSYRSRTVRRSSVVPPAMAAEMDDIVQRIGMERAQSPFVGSGSRRNWRSSKKRRMSSLAMSAVDNSSRKKRQRRESMTFNVRSSGNASGTTAQSKLSAADLEAMKAMFQDPLSQQFYQNNAQSNGNKNHGRNAVVQRVRHSVDDIGPQWT